MNVRFGSQEDFLTNQYAYSVQMNHPYVLRTDDTSERHNADGSPYQDNVERRESPFEMPAHQEFLTSHNRNACLRLVVDYYYKHEGIIVTPIFVAKTEFENNLLLRGTLYENHLPREFVQKAYDRYQEPLPLTTVDTIEATVNAIPMIVEESLSWKQVLEIRRDGASFKKLKRFRTWALSDLNGKQPNEIADQLALLIDDYDYALKKHGVLTAIGGLTTILTSTSTIFGAISSAQPALIAAGMSISAACISFSVKQISDCFDLTRSPIAYIYEIIDESKSV